MQNKSKQKISATQRGKLAEQTALFFLQKQGLSLLKQNFTCRLGEIDLIMQQADELAFIEVRMRTNTLYGDGFASVTQQKQRKIILAASLYLAKNSRYANANCRFDVISVSGSGNICSDDWIKHAFTA